MTYTLRIVFLTAIAIALHLLPQTALAGEQKAVLITGASTGIGRNMSERLALEGHFVYAGARKERDLKALDAIYNIMAVRLVVTSQE